MRTLTKRLAILVCSSGGAIGSHAFADCLRYTVLVYEFNCDLAPSSTGLALNQSGDVVGFYSCGGANDRACAMWEDNTQITALALPSTGTSQAQGINASREIVGRMEMGTQRGFLWRNGQTIDLGSLPNDGTPWIETFGINDSGVVVGSSSIGDGAVQHAYRWENGVMTDLNVPTGPNNEALAINNHHQIVGWMGLAPGGHFYAEAFLWNEGKVISLGKPAGASNSSATAINNSGIICGYYGIPDPQGPGGYKPRALAWINGEMFDLGVLTGYLSSWAWSVNDAGDIVGYCNNPPLLGNGVRAFLWRDGVMIALDNLRAPDSLQYQIWYAYGINNNGQIAAEVKPPTGSAMAALLTPVPPRAGDTNCDWLVNVSDLLKVINNWGPAPPDVPFQGSPDLNHDGVVNVNDLLTVISNWG